MKKLQYLLEYIGYRLIEFFAAYIPEILLIPKANFFAFLAFHILRIRRNVTLENLRIAFPEKSEKERTAIAYASYKHFALLILEFMRLIRWTPEQLEKMVEFESSEVLKKIMKEEKGVIINSAHFGNWEIIISYFSEFWMSTTGVQQKQKNPYIDKLMAEHRNRWGMEIVYSQGAVKNGVRALEKKRMLGLLGDQDGGAKGIFAPFFGRVASTPPGPAVIRVKSRSPIAFAYAIRFGKFKFRVGVEPLNIDDNFELTDENLKIITRSYLEILEKYIRQYPEQYFWMHRRWKTTQVEKMK